MKFQLLTSLLLASATLTWAVPSEINYQGRLTDTNGNAVTGDVTMSLKMFDAATDGNEIYSEDIGTVTLDSNGIYSFEFGASGQSVVSASESIATTDGTNSIFNATLENLPVDGSVSVSDGTYTWSQANGSSSSTEFTASVTPSSGAVSVIYLNGAPTSSVDITASYNYMDASLSGALSSHASHWLELSVDGTAQSPRERVLSVPFAQVAGSAQLIMPKKQSSVSISGPFYNGNSNNVSRIPLSTISNTLNSETSGYPFPYDNYIVTSYFYFIEGIPFAQLKNLRIFVSEQSDSDQFYGKFKATLIETNLTSGVSYDTVFESEVNSNSAIVIPCVPSGGAFDFSDNRYRLNLTLYHVEHDVQGPGGYFIYKDDIKVEKILLDYETE
ncbi:MAG: hypothetical protein VX033_02405 [Verrucomicrobiota bacterium]|nr:hypothetical protein [Verrucomicrobiota bacterium]